MTTPSLFFMAKPSTEVRHAMQQVLADNGWDGQLGDTLFAPDNWHQSLSHPMPSTPARRHALMEIGAHVRSQAFTLLLNRIAGTAADPTSIHWKFYATTRPAGLDALLANIRDGLQAQGLDGMPGHSPHVTVSYWAPHKLARQPIRPIPWRIDEVLLVESQGDPYRYNTLGRWSLRPAPQGLESQRELW
ncbi:2'-5' RNA ligase family protein [Pseudorhodoferax sp.]|uniref:2'-5' RNA ligase family protein n=1 Tax=Pseudorhodoferax sp. TaxID=1993553 RepID=UPI002DD65AFF|nr:2'-5' RNA ligase family protein [Pseudorhodoferax sp.]